MFQVIEAQPFPNLSSAVSWFGVSNATSRDVIVLYVLDTVTKPVPTVDTLSPLRFTWAMNAVGGNANGAGNLTFVVINQRFDIAFYYFRNITSTYGSVPAYTSAGAFAQTQVTNFISNPPAQGHLTFIGVPGCLPTLMTAVYVRKLMLGPRANASGYFWPGTFVTITIPNLPPSTTFFYQCT
ncbi:hypothetical protein WJX81_006005 [Elliptochloris bilobata]|uniref:Uncharacterized protein n=1 Tax=Elliptochloris bilobata TaxID=381761 RepID=A0AAW1RUK0_9CHLO